MRWVFDLDGTLIYTRAAHEAAYVEVGVYPPEDFHVRPWQEWCTEELHSRKNRALPRYLANYATPLQSLKILQAVGGEILTNASAASYQAIVAVFPILGQYRATIEHTPQQKLEWLLAEQGARQRPGIYVDDSEATLEQVRSKTRWQALSMYGS